MNHIDLLTAQIFYEAMRTLVDWSILIFVVRIDMRTTKTEWLMHTLSQHLLTIKGDSIRRVVEKLNGEKQKEQ